MAGTTLIKKNRKYPAEYGKLVCSEEATDVSQTSEAT
jgi:hypothetical protein